MRRHYLFTQDENERSVGEGKTNLLQVWHARRRAMLEGDESADGGEANAQVARELTLLWDLAKPLSCWLLSREGYVAFFARAAKALVQSLSSDAAAIAVAQRDWEYDLEGVGSVGESTKTASSLEREQMPPEQFREAVMQLAELVLSVESAPSIFATFFQELRVCLAEPAALSPGSEPEHDNANIVKAVERLTLRPLNRIPKIGNDAFLQKLPPASDALRAIRGLQPPDSREMSLKQLLLSYNPRKFALSRAFPNKVRANAAAIDKADGANAPKATAPDAEMEAQHLHKELIGAIGCGATPLRGMNLHRNTEARWDPEQAQPAALTEFPALKVTVVGPPRCGKTRLARVLTRRLGLRYLSLDGAVQRAVDRKLRLRRLRAATTAVTDEAAEVAEPPPAKETEEAPETQTEEAPATETEAETDEELDGAFTDADLDAMLSGRVVPRATALALLRLEATRSLLGTLFADELAGCGWVVTNLGVRCALAGVGVVMDDVYPHELAPVGEAGRSVAVDYLVALTALPGELEQQLAGSELAPTSRRVYSARELAVLQATNPEMLAASGFADFLLPEKKPEAETKAPEQVEAGNPPSDGPEPGSEGQETDEPPTETNEEENDGEVPSPEAAVAAPPPEPTPAERNEIEPTGEPTLPFASLTVAQFALRYHEYVLRMQNELVVRRSATLQSESAHLLVVLATQSLSVIRDHCIQTITGVCSSRLHVSRQACAVLLPADLSDASRPEKVRWLLYGDWTELLEAEASSTAEPFARLPRRDAKRRLLSKWREFCPVTSSDNALALGDPMFATAFSGRIYLLASLEAQRAFCAHPLQFLRREPFVSSSPRRLWLVTTDAGDVLEPPYLEVLETGLHTRAVRTADLLKTSASMALEMRLMSGQVISPVEAATAVAEALKAQQLKRDAPSGWMLMDLPLTAEVAAVLLEQGCVPEAIVLLDAEAPEGDNDGDADPSSTFAALRRQQFQAETASAADVAQALGGTTRVLTCPLFRQPRDTLAAIERELNPLAPRLDSVEDGHMPKLVDEYDPTVVFAPPPPEKDEEAQRTSSQDGDAADLEAEAARTRAMRLQGKTGRFCPVAWRSRGALVPGLPANVCAFQQQLYAFAGEKERRAFERDPAAFLPSGPRATATLVPCVLLLGVRGSGRRHIAAALAQAQTEHAPVPVEYVEVDLAAVASGAERRRLLEELKPEDARAQPDALFVEALQAELQRATNDWRSRQVLQSPGSAATQAIERAAALVIAGLGPESSHIPTAATLEACFACELFPTLVVPLVVSEDHAVNTLLSRWTASLPAPRRKLALVRKKERNQENGEDDGATLEDEEDAGDEGEPMDLEAAREEESERLHKQFAEDQEALDQALVSLRARGVSVSASVNASGGVRQTLKRVRRALDAFMARREALFERCEVLDMATGGATQQLLASGELLVGKHGVACPVTGRTDALSALAVVYRDQLYFPRSLEARQAFTASPTRYLVRSSLPPTHPPTCCVTGAPLAGKTWVARELATALGLVYVSPQSAVDWVVQCQGGSALRHRLLAIVEAQQSPLADADATHDAICTRLRSSECQTRGWVLDGYLLERHELQHSLQGLATSVGQPAVEGSSQSIQPDMLFVLERDFQRASQAHQGDRSDPCAAFERWQRHRLELLDAWTRAFGAFHVRQLDSSSNSLWRVAAQAQALLTEQQQLASCHAGAQASGCAACALGVSRSLNELVVRQHPAFQSFCPVELRAGRFNSSRCSSRMRCVDFRGSSFWISSDRGVAQFLASPEAFVGCLPGQIPAPASVEEDPEPWATQEEAEGEAKTLVAKAPVDASLLSLLTVPDCDFPELKGYCPVTFALGSGAKDWASLRRGSVFFRASYRSKAFFFASENARRQFCAEPGRYAAQSLPVKLPPQVTLAKSYPGKLEQQLSAVLNEALLALGSERPKFPQMSPRASACVFLALSLKALQRRHQATITQSQARMEAEPRDEEEPDEDQKQRQLQREEQAEREAIARRDAFARDCRLGEQLKAALTPAHASCGSGAKGARLMREAQDTSADVQHEEDGGDGAAEATDNATAELLRRRFDFIVAGSVTADKPLSGDVAAIRGHARAAFLEYTTASTSS
ncbi:hypothetical protein BBJ28_00000216 [Nothophytophthora sp. Chile5]|nr:hypothetical protein BBJ28_00000216 [Nothophytophthora sp. Chile5]